MTDFGRNRLKPISFSKYSKLDFLSKATCGMSLKNRLKSYKTNMKPWFIVVYLAVHVSVTITLLDNNNKNPSSLENFYELTISVKEGK